MASRAQAFGNGVLAGAAGTAVMTLLQHAEMRATGRPPSTTPGQAAAILLRRDRSEARRLSPYMHVAFGLTMGGLRGLLGPGASRTAAHYALVSVGDALLYKAMGIADWPWTWSRRDVIADVVGKGSYAASTGVVHDRLASR